MNGVHRPLIGVTGHGLEGATGSKSVAAGEAYLAAVRSAGGVPVVLPPTDDPSVIEETLRRLDGVLFTGGRDVDPKHYGEALLNDTVHVEPERDVFELPLARAALEHDLPVLAICRGCQVLNVAAGGSLWQDLPAQRPTDLEHYQRAARDEVVHTLDIKAGSVLARALGEFASGAIEANSFHHQAAREVAPGLTAVAFAADGTVEAIEAPARRFALGVQWHPENLALGRPEHRRLFEAFVRATSQR